MKIVRTAREPEEPVFIQLRAPRKFTDDVQNFQMAGSTLKNLKTVLTPKQMDQCAKAVTKDGILRALLNKLIYNIKGQRPKFIVKLNQELTEFKDADEIAKLEKDIFGQKADTIEAIQKDTVRINRRVKFSSALDGLLFTAFTFGRNFLEIHRFPTAKNFTLYGEPKALTLLQPRRIDHVLADSETGLFKGILYDQGGTRGKKTINFIDLIPAINNDVNLFDNTNFSGLSLVYPVLSVSQSNSVINDEDIPETVKQCWAKFGFIFAGTSKKQVLKKIRETIESSTYLVHNQKDLVAQIHDLARDLMELPNVRTANAKYMAWCMMMPLFLMFEDDANFATAAQAVQAFKVGVVDYYRTWIQGFLEDYWYDPILADHLGVPVEKVIAEDIRIKATWEDLVYDPFADKVDAYVKLKGSGIWDNEKINKELGADDVIQRQKLMQNSEEIDRLRGMIADMTKQLANQTQKGIDNPQEQMPSIPNRQKPVA